MFSQTIQQLYKIKDLKVIRRSHVLQLSVLAVFSTLFEAFSVGMIIPVIEYLNNSNDPDGFLKYLESAFQFFGLDVNLFTLCVVLWFMIFLRFSATFIMSVRTAQVKHYVGRALATSCFENIITANGAYTGSIGAGTFVNLLDHQCQATASLVSSYVTVFTIILTAFAYVAVTVFAAPLTSLAAFIMLGAAVFLSQKFIKRSRAIGSDLVKFRDGYIHYIGERYRAWRQIKLSNTVAQEVVEISRTSGRFARMSVALVAQSSRIPLFMGVGLSSLMLLGLFLAGSYLDLKTSTIPLFLIVMVRLLPTAQGMATQRNAIAIYDESLKRVALAMQEARENKEAESGGHNFVSLKNAITFAGVTLKYPFGENAALKGINLSIPAGKITAIIGPSGAGKSTLVDLLPRLIVPSGGRIMFDDLPHADIDLISLRAGISFASQEVVLLTATVAENIAYGQINPSRIEIEAAAQMAGADNFIRDLPRGYDTVIGDSERQLSGGQRQRLGLARAILKSAPIMILDEPTSALDIETEQAIMLAIRELPKRKNTTIILIAHRLSTVAKADKLVVLRDGQVVQEGAPSELKAQPGWYGDMLRISGDSLSQGFIDQ
ncbi:ABC transporter ATP-binding protein [Thalassospira xiamenensis]|uniref:ABC transporter ATP-binding protein n=1 Tax=Thalassospira xiamenensis TaxID=220697 RepID=UPI000DED6271|nr:ABC transporter ATP-binding protein [Thalassospira xiamenensis]